MIRDLVRAAAFALSSADCGEFGDLRTELTRELGKAHKRLERTMKRAPWNERTKDLLEDENGFHDFDEWCEWIYEKCPAVEFLRDTSQVELYVAMIELLDESLANYEKKGETYGT